MHKFLVVRYRFPIRLIIKLALCYGWGQEKLPFDYGEKNIAQPLFLYDSDGNYAVPVYSVKEFVLQLWRVDERDHVPAFLHETQEKITFAAISSDGTGLLTSLDRSLKIWRIFEQKLEFAAVYQHTFPITQLALSQDGKTAVIQDAQGLFIVLQVADKKFEIIAKLEQKESGLSAIFSFTNFRGKFIFSKQNRDSSQG